jgi:hypothetical protein
MEEDVNTYSSSSASRAGTPQPSFASGQTESQHKSEPGDGAMSGAQEMAADAAAAVSSQVKEMLNRQVGSGCDLASALAKSVKRAADDLDREAPQLAGLVRGAADRLDGVASDLHDQSIDQLVTSASNFTRRQPALMFGLAAIAGFMALRTVYSAAAASAHNRRDSRIG